MSLEAEALLNIHRTAGLLDAGMAEVLRPLDLSSAQYNVLRILRGAGKAGLPCGEIGCRMVTRDPDITRLLDRLSDNGLIERRADPDDRRAKRLYLTAAAQPLLERLSDLGEELMGSALAGLEQKDITLLVSKLSVVKDNLRRAIQKKQTSTLEKHYG